MRRWYAVHRKPREDGRAESHLSRRCYEIFRPLVRMRRRCSGQVATVIESLFSRYLFVHLDDVAMRRNTFRYRAPITARGG